MDKFGINAGDEVKAMIACCHSLPKYIIKRNSTSFPFLVLTEDDKYEWGCREDAVLLTNEQSKEIQKILAFRTSIEEYNKLLEPTIEIGLFS